ncbi:MAG: hypothetical protein R3C15_17930 [Thermoleophilia bacterium]
MRLSVRSLMALVHLMLVATLFVPAIGAGALSETPERTWVPDGPVFAVARSADGTVYLGGDFRSLGPRTGGFVPLGVSGGRLRAGWPEVDGSVRAIASDGAGGVFIGGTFSRVGGFVRGNLAHVRADGAVDPGWHPSVRGSVVVLAVAGGTVFAGGEFDRVRGQKRRNLVGLDAVDGRPVKVGMDADGPVEALVANDETLYVGGSFGRIGDQRRAGLAAVDVSTGQVTSWNPGPTASQRPVVAALAIEGDRVYVAGEFDSIGGLTRAKLAAIDATTGEVADWNPGAAGDIHALAVSDGTVYVGGFLLTPIGGRQRDVLAAIDAATGTARAWNPRLGDDPRHGYREVDALAVDAGTVYVGGVFSVSDRQGSRRLVAVDAETAGVSSLAARPDGRVSVIFTADGLVYVGGDFRSVAGVPRGNGAALDPETGRPTAWNPDANAPIKALATGDGAIYAAGNFSRIGGTTRSGLGALDPETGRATRWSRSYGVEFFCEGYGCFVGPSAILQQAGRLFIGGVTYAGDAPSSPETPCGLYQGPVALAGATGATIWATTLAGDYSYSEGGGCDPDFSVTALALDGATLYVGGDFGTIGLEKRSGIAALDAASGYVTEWDPGGDGGQGGADRDVSALAAGAGVIYASGNFNRIGGGRRRGLAALSTTTGRTTTWNPNPDGPVDALALNHHTLYVGGRFSQISDQSRSNIAALSTANGTARPWNPAANGPINAILAEDHLLIVAGEFTSIGGVPQSGIAIFRGAIKPRH